MKKGITTVTLYYVSIETQNPEKSSLYKLTVDVGLGFGYCNFFSLNSCFINENEIRGKTKEKKIEKKMAMRKKGKKNGKKNQSICRNRTAYRREKDTYRQKDVNEFCFILSKW